ncbi:hypothetical protein ACHQM5_019309 [Ranunculus cassubicifolius]
MDAANPNGALAQSLNAKVYGNGSETLVLAHGYGLDQSVWPYVLPDLTRHFKVVVYDLAFSGKVGSHVYDPKKYSSYYGYAEDLQNLLDEFQLSNTIFVGHSMSSMIGCIAAAQRPDLFKHLILLCGSPRFINDKDYNGGFETSDVEGLLAAMKQDFNGWCPNFASIAVGTNYPNAIEEFKGSLASMEPKIALDVARTIFLGDYRNILQEVKVPCTIIQSDNDINVPLSVVYDMKRRLGDYTRVEIIATEGHFPMLTAHAMLLGVLNRVLGLK